MRVGLWALLIGAQVCALGLVPPSHADPERADSLASIAASVRDSLASPALAPSDSAIADSSRVRARPDSLPFVLRRAASIEGLPIDRGGFTDPAGIAVDAFGRLYVTDAALHRMLRFDAHGAWVGEAGALGSGAGQMRRPGAVAILGTLNVAVLDEENRRVLSYDLFGRLIGTLIDLAAPDLEDQLGRIDPIDLAADRGGAVYVADAERDRILAFDVTGRYVRTVSGYGSGPGALRGLSGIAVASRGALVITERLNARVQRLDPAGRVLAAFDLPVRPSRGRLPVAVDDSGRVAVADPPTGRLWVFDRDGRPLAVLDGLETPRALTFARDGTLWIAEAGVAALRRYALAPHALDSPRREE